MEPIADVVIVYIYQVANVALLRWYRGDEKQNNEYVSTNVLNAYSLEYITL